MFICCCFCSAVIKICVKMICTLFFPTFLEIAVVHFSLALKQELYRRVRSAVTFQNLEGAMSGHFAEFPSNVNRWWIIVSKWLDAVTTANTSRKESETAGLGGAVRRGWVSLPPSSKCLWTITTAIIILEAGESRSLTVERPHLTFIKCTEHIFKMLSTWHMDSTKAAYVQHLKQKRKSLHNSC